MRATLYLAVSPSTSLKVMGAHHSELNTTFVFSLSRILKTWLLVGLGVFQHLLAGERLPGHRPAGGVADHAGEVADQEHHGVAHVLEMLHLAEQHRVAQVDVRGGGIEPRLDDERLVLTLGTLQLLLKFIKREYLLGSPHQQFYIVPYH